MTELERHGYRVLSRLGSGTTSTVYCVRSLKDGKNYACKTGVTCGLLGREAALLRELEHPAFPRFEEFWEAGGQDFLIMEYLMGGSLQQYLDRRGRAGGRDAVRIGLELAEALLYLHERQREVLYRDLKPCHVILQADGGVRLLDLGAACLREESARSRAGTPGYASPEQLKGTGGAGPSCDVYALGRLLYFLLTGKDPAVPPWDLAPMRMYVKGVSPGLERIVEGCVAQDVRERIPDMRRLISLLKPYGQAGPRSRRPLLRRGHGGRERFILRYEKSILKLPGGHPGPA